MRNSSIISSFDFVRRNSLINNPIEKEYNLNLILKFDRYNFNVKVIYKNIYLTYIITDLNII